MSAEFILLTGGARSGKSRFALTMAEKMGGRVLFAATAEAGDEEMASRIENHKRERPPHWETLEAPTDIGQEISRRADEVGVVIVDCITLLVNNVFSRYASADDATMEEAVIKEVEGLTECIRQHPARFIVVTNELGLGLVPTNSTSRLYRDVLGRANQRLAEAADEVYMLISGVPLRIKPSQGSGEPIL